MIKILIENDENGNRMKVLEPNDGAKTMDILTMLSSPLMNLILDACDHDRQKSVDVLTVLLDAYIETSDDENND